MNRNPRCSTVGPKGSVSTAGTLAGVCAAVLCPAAMEAQQVLAPPPADYTARPVVDPLADPEAELEPSALGTLVGTAEGAMQWVVSHLHPHLAYRFLYGDGIQAAPGQQVKTAIHEVYPGLSLNVRNNFRLAYAPVIRFYSSDKFEDGVDHNVSFAWDTQYRDWGFRLNHNFALTSQPLVETGGQTDTEAFATAAGAVWSMNESLALELGLMHNIRNLSGGDELGRQLSDMQNFSTLNWLTYRFAPGLSASIGVGAGYDDVSAGPDMTYEQLWGRVAWRVKQRLSLTVGVGGEARQFLDSDAADNLAPIFNGTVAYQLFDPTRLFVSGSRAVSPSYFADELTESTQVSVGIQQRLLGKLTLSVAGGYGFTSYEQALTQDLDVSREDEFTFFNARLQTVFFKRATAALFYQHSENTSDVASYKYTSDQVGVEIGYKF